MSTSANKKQNKKAVIFTEGDTVRAVATWMPIDDLDTNNVPVRGYDLMSIEMEVRGTSAMNEPRWESCGVIYGSNDRDTTSGVHLWIAHLLIARAKRWQKENL